MCLDLQKGFICTMKYLILDILAMHGAILYTILHESIVMKDHSLYIRILTMDNYSYCPLFSPIPQVISMEWLVGSIGEPWSGRLNISSIYSSYGPQLSPIVVTNVTKVAK